ESIIEKVPDFLGPYPLAPLIRVGRTSQVWEAIHHHDKKRYALKVLRPEQRGNKEEIGFLKHEFEVAKELNHKNIIKLIEYRTNAETPFIVMELFSELNLKMAIRKGPEAIAYQLAPIVDQSCESLYYLHSKGYVHCDIKPDNLLLSRNWEVKLIDFTIAKKIRTGIGKLFGGKNKVEGTRSYMSPEQIKGGSLDPRSDIYSMGCMIYELIGGKPPYTANTPNDLLNKHVSAPIPSLLVNNDNVSPEFNNIVRKMLAKKPEDRPQDMWDVIKMVRTTPIFKKPPRIPPTNPFDDYQGGGRIEPAS
ncbi:MAG: serine/threonine-protein kinase, partial [Planctomycetota bacterium]